MKLSRNTTNAIRFVIDEFLPPIIRESRLCMYPAFKIFFGDNTDLVMNFKQTVFTMTDKEITGIYQKIEHYSNERVTDLNTASLSLIKQRIIGKKVVDVGCGRGYLAGILAEHFKVTGVDIVLNESIQRKNPAVTFKKGAVEKIPFPAHSFDTVVCTHTLEHVKDFQRAVKELRRIAKKRIIIVVPKQRPYKYTFDLHLHFFLYPFILTQAMGNNPNSICEEVDGDLFYMEDIQS